MVREGFKAELDLVLDPVRRRNVAKVPLAWGKGQDSGTELGRSPVGSGHSVKWSS